MSTALAAAVLTVRACWSDPEGVDRPDGSEAVVAEEVVAVSAAASGVWGDGRALHAMALDANVTAVVSTTGVYLSEAGGPIDDLDQFGQPTEVGTVALSSDRSTLAIVSLWPSVVHWYDLVERRPAGVAEVGPGGDLFEFGFLGDTGVLTAVTPTGVSLWPTGPAGRITTPLTDARPTGRPTIVDDRLLVPIANSTDIAVVGPESVEWTSIAAPDDAVLLCVRSSPDVSTVGIAYFTPEIGDTIAVVDATSVDPIGTVSVGVPVQAGAWALTDRVVTVADGTSVIMWTHAGDWLGADQAPTDRAIDELLSRDDRIVAAHHGGATAIMLDDGVTSARLIDDGGFALESAVVDAELGELVSVDFHGRISRSDLVGERAPMIDGRFAAGHATAVSIDAVADRVAAAATTGKVELLDAQLDRSGGFSVRAAPSSSTMSSSTPPTDSWPPGWPNASGRSPSTTPSRRGTPMRARHPLGRQRSRRRRRLRLLQQSCDVHQRRLVDGRHIA